MIINGSHYEHRRGTDKPSALQSISDRIRSHSDSAWILKRGKSRETWTLVRQFAQPAVIYKITGDKPGDISIEFIPDLIPSYSMRKGERLHLKIATKEDNPNPVFNLFYRTLANDGINHHFDPDNDFYPEGEWKGYVWRALVP